MNILGIESSCDETAAAVIQGRKILSDEIASSASIPDCQSIVKRAVVARLSEKYGVSWFTENSGI